MFPKVNGITLANSENNVVPIPFQIKAKPWPIPKTDLPWGLAQAWFDNTNAKIVGITGAPIIKMIGEKRKELMIKTPDERILSVCHIYDAEGIFFYFFIFLFFILFFFKVMNWFKTRIEMSNIQFYFHEKIPYLHPEEAKKAMMKVHFCLLLPRMKIRKGLFLQFLNLQKTDFTRYF